MSSQPDISKFYTDRIFIAERGHVKSSGTLNLTCSKCSAECSIIDGSPYIVSHAKAIYCTDCYHNIVDV